MPGAAASDWNRRASWSGRGTNEYVRHNVEQVPAELEAAGVLTKRLPVVEKAVGEALHVQIVRFPGCSHDTRLVLRPY